MYLELKRIKEYLHGNIRQLTRLAKKAGHEMAVLMDGQVAQSMTMTISKSGPVVEEGFCRMEIFCGKNGYFIILKKIINFNEPFNAERLMANIEQNLAAHGIPRQSSGDGEALVGKNENVEMDERLLTADGNDLLNFFRSRFLVDSPKKILYQAQFARGFTYQGYAREKKELELNASSFFDITAKLRSKTVSLTYHCSGGNMREMNLFPIRPHLSAFWDAKPADDNEIPDMVVLGAQALAKCADACLRELKRGNTYLWNWLDKCDVNAPLRLPNLMATVGDQPSDISAHVSSRLSAWKQKPGACQDSLGDVLMGRSQHFEKAIFIHDIAKIYFNKSQMHIITHGTSLFLQSGKIPKHTNAVVEVKLESQLFNHHEQWISSRLCLIRHGLEQGRHMHMPEYCIKRRALDPGRIPVS